MQTERFDQALAWHQWRWHEVDDLGFFSEHWHDALGQTDASQCFFRLFANQPSCPEFCVAYRSAREHFQSGRKCFCKELADIRRIEFLCFVRRLAFHQIYLASTASLSDNIDLACRVTELKFQPEPYIFPAQCP